MNICISIYLNRLINPCLYRSWRVREVGLHPGGGVAQTQFTSRHVTGWGGKGGGGGLLMPPRTFLEAPFGSRVDSKC